MMNLFIQIQLSLGGKHMSVPFTNTSLVKDIVNEAPKTSDVFKKHRIDFCCGGNIPISQQPPRKICEYR